MFIKSLTISNYGPFDKCNIQLWNEDNSNRKISILIGENGAGKTAFLEAIVTLLSWLVAKIQNKKNSGSPIEPHRIHHNGNYAELSCVIHAESNEYSWSLVKTKKGTSQEHESSLKDSSKLASLYANKISHAAKASLPLIVYYSTERYVLDVPKKILKNYTFSQIDGYRGALSKGVDFRSFFEWFRSREDIFNERKVSVDEIFCYIDKKKLLQDIEKNSVNNKDVDIYNYIDIKKLQKENITLFDKIGKNRSFENEMQFFAVMRAIESFMPGYGDLRIQRHPKMRMLLDKEGVEFDIMQLSQGEKSLLALVGDIARRLAIMNPSMTNPLEGEGIILIDEVDLHLHPQWQRTIVGRLRETFPNCQFILTTHSPLVVSYQDNVQTFLLSSGKIDVLPNIYGMDIEQLYLDIMNTPLRDEKLQKEIDAVYEEIQNGRMDEARKLIKKLEEKLPADHVELVKANILIRRFEVMREKNK